MTSALERAEQAGVEPSRQAVAAQERSAPGQVTGKLRRALEAMVWQGSRREQAAATAGITDHSLRTALAKPHVKAWYMAQLQVLRDSARAKNIHRLTEIRDAANNMPAVQAIKALEQLEEVSASTSNVQRNPGLQIVILQAATSPVLPSAPTLEHEPTVPQRLPRD